VDSTHADITVLFRGDAVFGEAQVLGLLVAAPDALVLGLGPTLEAACEHHRALPFPLHLHGPRQFYVRVVHHDVFRQELLELVPRNYLELGVALDGLGERLERGLELVPLLLLLVDLGLRVRKLLVEHGDILVLSTRVFACDLGQLLQHFIAEALHLFHKGLLHREQVPILSDGIQEVVEERLEVYLKLCTHLQDVGAQMLFVIGDAFYDLVVAQLLPLLHVRKRRLDFGGE
jgi:hypothetical protein